MEKPRLSLQAYYGFNSELVNPRDIKKFTIRQVFERGTSGDIGEIFRVYGQEEIVRVLRNSNNLSLRAIKLAKTVLHMSDSEFRRRPRLHGFSSTLAHSRARKKRVKALRVSAKLNAENQ